MADLDLLQGTLDLLVLRTLAFGPQHGFGISRWIRQTTGGDLAIEDGALYTALHRLEDRGWVDATWGVSDNNRRAKFYRLTTAGRRQLRDQTARWSRYTTAVGKVLAATPA